MLSFTQFPQRLPAPGADAGVTGGSMAGGETSLQFLLKSVHFAFTFFLQKAQEFALFFTKNSCAHLKFRL